MASLSGFGHRDVGWEIDAALTAFLWRAVEERGVTEFYSGAMGGFDMRFCAAVRVLRRQYPNIRLYRVIYSYAAVSGAQNGAQAELYDGIVFPEEAGAAYPRAAIAVRNRWMIDRCDGAVFFVSRHTGGAYAAMRYAARRGKLWANLAELPPP